MTVKELKEILSKFKDSDNVYLYEEIDGASPPCYSFWPAKEQENDSPIAVTTPKDADAVILLS